MMFVMFAPAILASTILSQQYQSVLLNSFTAEKFSGNATPMIKDQMQVGDSNVLRIRMSRSGGTSAAANLTIEMVVQSPSGKTKKTQTLSAIAMNSSTDSYGLVQFSEVGKSTISITAKYNNVPVWTDNLSMNVVANGRGTGGSVGPANGSYRAVFTTNLSNPVTSELTVKNDRAGNYIFTGWISPVNGQGLHLQIKGTIQGTGGSLIAEGTDKDGKPISITLSVAFAGRFLLAVYGVDKQFPAQAVFVKK